MHWTWVGEISGHVGYSRRDDQQFKINISVLVLSKNRDFILRVKSYQLSYQKCDRD